MSLDNIRKLLLNSLSNIFNKAASTRNYQLMTAVANELTDNENNIEQMRRASTINEAISGDLDLHGTTLNVKRIYLEDDEAYRIRLLESYDRPQVTSSNLKELAEFYVGSTVIKEEYIKDRWWLGGNLWPVTEIEIVPAITSTIAQTTSGALTNTMPECWSILDILHTGTNYCSGCSFTNNSSGALITLTTPVTAGDLLQVVYTLDAITSGSNIDWVPHGFLGYDAIIHHRVLSNNYDLITSNIRNITIQTNMLPGYAVYTSLFNIDTGIIYGWQNTVDSDGQIILDENTRVDNLVVDEYQIADDVNQVSVNHSIAKVVSVYLAIDVNHTGTNYATTNNFNGNTVILDIPLPSKTAVIVNYNRYPIQNYRDFNIDNFVKTGDEDLRFTMEFQLNADFIKYNTAKYSQISWGQLANDNISLVAEAIDIAKAAGIKTKLIIVSKGAIYGQVSSVYAQVFYGGQYY